MKKFVYSLSTLLTFINSLGQAPETVSIVLNRNSIARLSTEFIPFNS